MLFSQVSLCFHIHTVCYWTKFKLRSVHPHLLYAFTRITQCMFTSRWPRQCIPICIHNLGFWQQSQNHLVAPMKQHKDVDQLIAHTSTLKFLAA